MTLLVLRPAAVADVTEAHAHYHDLVDAHGDRFVVAVDELFARLTEFPGSTPVVAGYRDVRRAVVRGSPTSCSTATSRTGSRCSGSCTRPGPTLTSHQVRPGHSAAGSPA